MNQAPPNKMFDAKYRAKWPTAVQALRHLEKCAERVALLVAEGLAADDPRLVAAKVEAKRADDDYKRAEKTDEAMRFQSVNGPLKCLCGSHLTPDVIRCPNCNNKRRAG